MGVKTNRYDQLTFSILPNQIIGRHVLATSDPEEENLEEDLLHYLAKKMSQNRRTTGNGDQNPQNPDFKLPNKQSSIYYDLFRPIQ